MKRSGIRNPGTPGRRRRARCEEGISQASPRVTRDDYTELRIAGSEADGGAVAYKPIGFTVYVETQYISCRFKGGSKFVNDQMGLSH